MKAGLLGLCTCCQRLRSTQAGWSEAGHWLSVVQLLPHTCCTSALELLSSSLQGFNGIHELKPCNLTCTRLLRRACEGDCRPV